MEIQDLFMYHLRENIEIITLINHRPSSNYETVFSNAKAGY